MKQGFVYGSEDGSLHVVDSDWQERYLGAIESTIYQILLNKEKIIVGDILSSYDFLEGKKIFQWKGDGHLNNIALHKGNLFHATTWNLFGPGNEVISKLSPKTSSTQYKGIFSIGRKLYHILTDYWVDGKPNNKISKIVDTESGQTIAERPGELEGMAGNSKILVDFNRQEIFDTKKNKKIVNLEDLQTDVPDRYKSYIYRVLVDNDKIYFITRGNGHIYRTSDSGTKRIAERGWNGVDIFKMNGKLYDVTCDAVIRTYATPEQPTRTFGSDGHQYLTGLCADRSKYGDILVHEKVNSVLLYHPSAVHMINSSLVDKLKSIEPIKFER